MLRSCSLEVHDPVPDPTPLVTIITPAFNRADYLGDVIESVLQQDYPNIEHIVLDDGSTDSTSQVIGRFTPRIRAVSHANIGETRTVNRGFELATGEILGVVNSDDPLLPGAVRSAVRALTSHPDLVVVYPDWVMIDQNGSVLENVTTHEYNYVDMIRWHHCVPGPGTFFRHELADVLGGRDLQFRYVADFDFWLRAGLVGPFRRLPETLATFRSHPGGATSKAQGRAMAEEHLRLVRKIFALPNVPDEVRAVRREAFGSANYVAGAVLGGGSSLLKKRYFATALLMSPKKYRSEYRERLPVMRSELRYGWRQHAMDLVRRAMRQRRSADTTST